MTGLSRSCLRLCLRLCLWLCCAWLWLRTRHVHPTLRLSCSLNILTPARLRLNNLRPGCCLRPCLRLASTRNVLPPTRLHHLRLRLWPLAVSYCFSASLRNSATLHALLFDLLLPLLLRRSALSLFSSQVCLALLLL